MPAMALANPIAGHKSSEKNSDATDDSLGRKHTSERRRSKTRRDAETTTKSMDKSTSESFKRVQNAMANRSIDFSIDLQALFLDTLAKWEEEDKKPFGDIRIIIGPKLPRDFGMSAEIRPGVIDSNFAEILSKAAASNMAIMTVYADEPAIKQYLANVAYYGCLIGQGFLNLQEDLADLGIKTVKSKDEFVADISYEDMMILAEGALLRAVDQGFSGPIRILNDSINRDLKRQKCYFDNAGHGADRIKCGRSVITLAASPALWAQGRDIYGSAYAGFKGGFKVSSGMGWSAALDKMESTSTASRFAKEISKSRDKLLSLGKHKEAVLMSKTAWDSMVEASAGVNVSPTN